MAWTVRSAAAGGAMYVEKAASQMCRGFEGRLAGVWDLPRKDATRRDQGVVVTERRLVNQRGEIVQEGRAHLLVRRRL